MTWRTDSCSIVLAVAVGLVSRMLTLAVIPNIVCHVNQRVFWVIVPATDQILAKL